METHKDLHKVILKAKKGYNLCGQCCHVGGWQRESRTPQFVFCFCFFLSEGMFSAQTSPEETNVNPRWEKYYERQLQGLCMNSRNLTRTNYFPECEETCKGITLKALSKGQNSGGRDLLQFLNQWGSSTPHATGHCIESESQNQNGLLMRWPVGASEGQWSLGVRVGGEGTFPSLPFSPQRRFNTNISNELHRHWVISIRNVFSGTNPTKSI